MNCKQCGGELRPDTFSLNARPLDVLRCRDCRALVWPDTEQQVELDALRRQSVSSGALLAFELLKRARRAKRKRVTV